MIESPNFTQTPNALFDLLPGLGEAEMRIALALARETFGWHREGAALSYSDFERLTGLSRPAVAQGLKAAMERGLIERSPDGASYVYRFVISPPEKPAQERSAAPPEGREGSQQKLPQVVNEINQQVVNEINYTQIKGKENLKKPSPPPQQDILPYPDVPAGSTRREGGGPVPPKPKPPNPAGESTSRPAAAAAAGDVDLSFLGPDHGCYEPEVRALLRRYRPGDIPELVRSQWGRSLSGSPPLAWLRQMYLEHGYAKILAAIVITGDKAQKPCIPFAERILGDFQPTARIHHLTGQRSAFASPEGTGSAGPAPLPEGVLPERRARQAAVDLTFFYGIDGLGQCFETCFAPFNPLPGWKENLFRLKRTEWLPKLRHLLSKPETRSTDIWSSSYAEPAGPRSASPNGSSASAGSDGRPSRAAP